MSSRLLALVLILAAASAVVGAGAAFLVRQSDDAPPAASQVSAATARSTSAPAADSQPDQAAPAPGDAAQDKLTAAAAPDAEQQPQPAEAQASVADQAQDADQAGREQDDGDERAGVEAIQQAQEQQAQEQAEAEQEQAALLAIEQLPDLSIDQTVLRQGEAFALTLESERVTAAVATIGARSWTLSEIAPGVWWTIIAIPRDAEIGYDHVETDLYGAGGAWLRRMTSSIEVLASAAPFEEVILGGAGITVDPAGVQRDHDVRFVDNVAVSGPARWQGPWILPAAGEVSGVFGSKRSYDGVPADGWHHGHDIAADHGDPIVAPAAGTIVWTGDLAIHGMGVIIDHGAGVYSGYWHMSLIAVREGAEVAAGDWLGNIGSTGLSTGPHLHWEVIVQGVDVDPVQWLGEDQPSLPPLPAAEPERAADTLG